MIENSEELQRELLSLLEEKERRSRYSKRDDMFPTDGPYAKKFYPKHVAFIEATKRFRQIAFVAANRVGKTRTGAYLMSYWLTGDYPENFDGYRFDKPVRAWCAGVTAQAVKDVMQFELLGPNSDLGSGMIPRDRIIKTIRKPGVSEAIETVQVRHSDSTCNCTGSTTCPRCKISELTFKTYEQGRDSFQGAKLDVIWLDEEPRDYGIYSECVTRTDCAVGEHRLIMNTFTPLFGLSDVVLQFMPDGIPPYGGIHPSAPYRYIATATWDDVPHLSEEWKTQAMATYSRHELEARTRGLPTLGSGAIYPYAEEDVIVDDFDIPEWWPRCFGLDVGWKCTAAVWLALNKDTGTWYAYSEHYGGEQVIPIHASAIKARGDYIVGAIDPAAGGTSLTDGQKARELYENEGLYLVTANNSVEAGIQDVSRAFATGQLKIFKSLSNSRAEMRVYRRDEKGQVVKKRDHAMDALRYVWVSGREHAISKAEAYAQDTYKERTGFNPVTGY